MSNSNIFDQYVDYVTRYTQEFGENTVVLIQVGSFLELYDDGTNTVNIRAIADLLNIIVSKRNKNIPEVSRNNVLMAGVPIWAKTKYLSTLVNNNFTVVLVEQVTDPPNPIRKVTEILSPGVPMNYEIGTANTTNYLATIYFEEASSVVCGFAAIDVLTGDSVVTECVFKNSLDDVYRLLSTYCPKEIVLFGDVDGDAQEKIMSFLEMDNAPYKIHNRFNLFDKEVLKSAYQESLLRGVFPNTGMLSAIEFLDLENLILARSAFVYLLQFTTIHNEFVLHKLSKPRIIYDHNYLKLSFNSLHKLDILAGRFHNNSKDLYTMLSCNCSTSIGRRLYKDRLTQPITDARELEKRYDAVESMINTERHKLIQKHFKNVYDIERLFRKICTRKLHPCEWISIDNTFDSVLRVLEQVSLKGRIESFMCHYRSILNMELIDKYNNDNIDSSFITPGFDLEIDRVQKSLDSAIQSFSCTTNVLNNHAQGSESIFKLDNNDRDGYFIVITAKRFNDFIKLNHDLAMEVPYNNSQLSVQDVVAKPVSSTSSVVRLKHPLFDLLNKDIVVLRTKIRKMVTEVYSTFLQNVAETHEHLFKDVVQYIATEDVTAANATNAVQYCYCRPRIDTSNDNSYVSIKGVRHPIIERLINVPYVPNDIDIGLKEQGILLYGTNATGKSSLGKSIAIAIIMAQSGMFVPASDMILSLFTKIFARISTGDDLYKGHSTFVVEMLELRNILQVADKNSFCISDELANGTESISGTGIVAAVIDELCSKKCSFITASHLHEIVDLPSIQNLSKTGTLKIAHLEVSYDEVTKQLVYDRKIKNGSGSSVYGLEVCKSLGLPTEFLEKAYKIRASLVDKPILCPTKKSKYNSNVYVHQCEICSRKTDEIHHIQPQALADDNGVINNLFHKNAIGNLMNVCAECHDKIHSGSISVQGYMMTSNGRQLMYSIQDEHKDSMAVNAFVQTCLANKESVGNILCKLNEKYQSAHFTRYKVNKIIKEIKTLQ